jgi:hypothetical protein
LLELSQVQHTSYLASLPTVLTGYGMTLAFIIAARVFYQMHLSSCLKTAERELRSFVEKKVSGVSSFPRKRNR